MFGYITADTRKLSKAERADYHRLYCGLCNSLGKRYGVLSRLMLSFDTAFLLTLLESGEGESSACIGHCPYKLGKRCGCVTGNNADYCADVTVLLFGLKLEDDIKDERSLKARLLLKLFKKQFEKASERLPDLAGKIEAHLSRLSRTEKTNETNPDIPANIFGDLLSDVFSRQAALKSFGFYLGKFIYLADAACDFKSDLKHGRYNPLVTRRKDDFYRILAGVLGECCKEYDKLNIKQYRSIIENVLYDGVWLKINLKGIYDNGSV